MAAYEKGGAKSLKKVLASGRNGCVIGSKTEEGEVAPAATEAQGYVLTLRIRNGLKPRDLEQALAALAKSSGLPSS